MKKKWIALLLVILTNQLLLAQVNSHCGFDALSNMIKESDSLYNKYENNFNAKCSLKNKGLGFGNQQRYYANGPEYIIPVVVHVVHSGEPIGNGTNISYAQIQSQIDALNAAFSNYSSTVNYYQSNVANQYNNPSRRGVNGVDSKIRFCLASNLGIVSNNGYQISGEVGVIRYNNSANTRHEMSSTGQSSLMNLTHPSSSNLSPENYFNIWIVTSIYSSGNSSTSGDIPGIQGYAPIPVDLPYVNMGWPLRGVVIRSDLFGDNSVNANNFVLQPNLNPSIGGVSGYVGNQGKVLVHEVGHALGLYHTFHTYAQTTTNPCDLNGGDLVNDTPPCDLSGLSGYSAGQPQRNTCHTDAPDVNDLVEDFMYYGYDDVLNTFTHDQAERMYSVIDQVYPNLTTTSNLFNTGIIGANGCIASVLSADFTAPLNNCINTPVNFSGINQVANTAANWNWQVSPTTGVTAVSNNTNNSSFVFSIPGTYSITLEVTDLSGNIETETKTIYVTSCNLSDCQKSNAHTILGRGAHIDFNSGGAVPMVDAYSNASPFRINSYEANYTQSDSSGNLVFYTDGNFVWNAQHQIININSPIGGSTSVHQIIGRPFPGHPNQYIIFIPPSAEEGHYNFRYAIIDLNSGAAIPVSAPASITTTVYTSEGIEIIPHCNGIDYWVIVYTSPNVAVYLVTSAGISSNPVNLFALNYGTIGYPLSINSNRLGDKIILGESSFDIMLLDFDNSSGILSNLRMLQGSYISSCFSPDGSKLFTSDFNGISQWQINSNSITLINSSVVNGSYFYGNQLFLGPDDKIYFMESGGFSTCYWQQEGSFAIYNFLGVIPNPNSINPTYQSSAVNLNLINTFCGVVPDQGIRFSPPNFVDACSNASQSPDFSFVQASCSTASLSLLGCFNNYSVTVNWGDGNVTTGDFGVFQNQGGLQHNYLSNGTFSITVTLSTSGSILGTVGVVNLTPIIKTITISNTSSLSVVGSGTVCSGSQAQQYIALGDISGLYQWGITGSGNSILGVNSGIGLNSVNINWLTSGVISCTYSSGSCTRTGSLQVVVQPCQLSGCQLSVLSQTICSGTCATLTASGANTYSWSTGSTSASITVCPLTTTIYTVGSADGISCNSTTTVQVTVLQSPTASLSASSTTICAGESVTLTATGSDLYAWGDIGAALTTTMIVVSPTETTTYSVTGLSFGMEEDAPCLKTATVTIYVASSLSIVSSSSQTICSGSCTTLTASGANTYSWSTGSTSASITVCPLTTTIYTVGSADSISCNSTTTVQVTVLSSPIVSLSASSTTICAGESVTLTATGSDLYAWGDIGAALTTTMIVVSPTETTTYSVTGLSFGMEEDAPCIQTSVITIYVASSPDITIVPSSSTICAGNPYSLTASGATSYTWSSGTFTSTSNPFVGIPPNAGNYSVSVVGVNANGCIGYADTMITVVNAPIVTATSSTICAGSCATLTASGANTYTWVPTNSTLNPAVVCPSVTTIYTVTGSNANGCIGKTTTQVFVNPLPIITISPASPTVCSGTTVNLTAGGAFTYTWNTGATTPIVNVSPTVTSIYTVTGTAKKTSCSSTQTVAVTIRTVTPINIIPSRTVVCGSGLVSFTASAASNYTWTSSPTVIINYSLGQPNVVSANLSSTTTFTVRGVTSTGCVSQGVITVSVVPNPTITATSSTICAGSCATLAASGANTYTWVPTNSTLNPAVVCPSVTTTYTVTGSNNFGCRNKAVSNVYVTGCIDCDVKSSFLYNVDKCELVNTSLINPISTVVLYEWTLTDINTGSILYYTTTNVDLTLVPNGTYKACLTVIGNNGLCNDTYCENIEVKCGLEKKPNTIRIYPNPASSLTIIEGIEVDDNIEIFDGLGKSQYFDRLSNVKHHIQINLKGFKTGIYFVKITNSNGNFEIKKLVIE